MVADEAVLKALRSSGAVETASSEEQPHDIALGGFGYSVRGAGWPWKLWEAGRALYSWCPLPGLWMAR